LRDFWQSHLGFETFREFFAAEYESFNRWAVAEGLIEKQQLVGEYYLGDEEDGENLVSAEG
jgi:hypothetical protein